MVESTQRAEDTMIAHQPSPEVPAGLARTISSVYGPKGVEWLERLPSLLAECERRWSITVLAPFPNLSYNYVTPAVGAGGRELVLKLGVPNPELRTEIEALRAYDGRGCVRLLAADPDQAALLLERLRPGTPLSACPDDERATSIAAQLMRHLWRPVPPQHSFPTVARWAVGLGRLRARYAGTTGPLPTYLVERAEAQFAALLGSPVEPMLLHGDLHHDNVLAADREPWLVIDPKGVVGDPAYEVGALLHNPFPQLFSWPNLAQILARRVDQLAEELEFERERIASWGLAQAVLAAWWCLEDGTPGWEGLMACARLLAALPVCDP
jgi:streptomycin 6-kinase